MILSFHYAEKEKKIDITNKNKNINNNDDYNDNNNWSISEGVRVTADQSKSQYLFTPGRPPPPTKKI